MRFVYTAFAFVVAAGSMLTSAADARAQSSNINIGNLAGFLTEGAWQFQVGNNDCKPLKDVTVTVAVTQDIIVASGGTGYDPATKTYYPYNGFGMQLNANGKSSGLTPGQVFWPQFIITAETIGGYGLPGVNAFVQTNATPGEPLVTPNPVLMGKPSTMTDTFLTIPAGTTFTWTLKNDQNGDVASCTFEAKDTIGTPYTKVTTSLPQEHRAPIYSIAMEIVGYNLYSTTTFKSGAGSITYTGTTFTMPYAGPGCANNWGTGENSNAVYGPLVASGGKVTQSFFTSTVGTFLGGNTGYPGNYPTSLGDWAYGSYKGVCPLGQPMYGVSRVPNQRWSNAVECGMPLAGAGGQAAYSNNGTGCYARPAYSYDNRGYTDNGLDWDPGSYKTECRGNEYVAGISQASGNGVLTSILCCPSLVTHQSCVAQVFYGSDSPAYAGAGPDWDPTHLKGQCPAGKYVAGISTPAYAQIGTPGAAHAILCCSQ